MPSKVYWCLCNGRGGLNFDTLGSPLIFKAKSMAESYRDKNNEIIAKCRVTWAIEEEKNGI